ncbi:GSCFA domain-containing protein [Flavobacterium sp. RHBU_24]|uniref:GSCFA domain-containing protein n=1 Tax=Flavobacterium sp. RHBU_24 TaxID=3391185 RepID=UPI003984DDFF
MQFTTQIPLQQGNPAIDYNSHIVSLGSCFAVNIGQKLDYFKFRNVTNPFGILFHPLAIEKIIGFAVNGYTFTGADIFFHNERWHSFDAHSDLSHADKDVLLQNLNNATALLGIQLKQVSHIIITLGTSWVYRFTESNALVANCHKVAQKEFTKELLSIDVIAQSLQNICSLVGSINPSAKIIFTVSPVRHIKDGFTENQLSKANLVSALHSALQVPPLGVRGLYFPSYEIMMDELRDYRFYAEDMIHPNQVAIDYIWQQFTSAWISEEAQHTMKLADTIQKSLQHRPFNPESESHKKFTANLGTKIAMLQQQHPHIQF